MEKVDAMRTSLDQLETVKQEHKGGQDLAIPASLAALDDAEFQALGRKATLKMDLTIMPILVIMYILNYLDRQNIASAKLADITDDLHLSPVDYQTAVSILFCGYSKLLPDLPLSALNTSDSLFKFSCRFHPT